MYNKSDIEQDDMKLHIKYFKDEGEKINNTKPLLKIHIIVTFIV